MKKLSTSHIDSSVVTTIENIQKSLAINTKTFENISLPGNKVDELISAVYKLDAIIKDKNKHIGELERKCLPELAVNPETAITEISDGFSSENGPITVFLAVSTLEGKDQFIEFLEEKINDTIGEYLTERGTACANHIDLYRISPCRYNEVEGRSAWGRLLNYKLVVDGDLVKIYGLLYPASHYYGKDHESPKTFLPKVRFSTTVIEGEPMSTSIIAIDLVQK